MKLSVKKYMKTWLRFCIQASTHLKPAVLRSDLLFMQVLNLFEKNYCIIYGKALHLRFYILYKIIEGKKVRYCDV